MSDEIGTIDSHRGVGIDDCQSPERVDRVVKPAIDAVFAMSGIDELFRYCADPSRPPEARRFAAAKLEAARDVSAAGRIRRPDVDVGVVHAAVAGLGSRKWRCPVNFGSLLDHSPASGQPGPEVRPPEYQRQVEDDQIRAADEERAVRPG